MWFILLWNLNNIVFLAANILICNILSITIEKRRFSVFVVCLESKVAGSVRIRQREATNTPIWITYSDSEYELLLSIQIKDSHILNVTTNERLA